MRRTIKKTITVILFLTLAGAVSFLTYLHFFAADERNLSGEWSAELDMTERALVTAVGWLQDIEAVSVSPEEVETYLQGLTIQVNLTMEQKGRYEGTFQCSILPESYDACRQAAYEGFAAAFKALLAERLRMAGYTGSTEPEDVDALVNETFGMSAVDYLMAVVPGLLPSLEEMQAQYDGSGIYETHETESACILTRQYEAGGIITIRAERYIRKDAALVLYAETDFDDSATEGFLSEFYPIIYLLQEEEEEGR